MLEKKLHYEVLAAFCILGLIMFCPLVNVGKNIK